MPRRGAGEPAFEFGEALAVGVCPCIGLWSDHPRHGRLIERCPTVPSGVSCCPLGLVAEDGVEECRELCGEPKRSALAVEVEEGLLDRVHRQRVVGRESSGDAEGPIPVAAIERLEGRGITSPDRLDEFLIVSVLVCHGVSIQKNAEARSTRRKTESRIMNAKVAKSAKKGRRKRGCLARRAEQCSSRDCYESHKEMVWRMERKEESLRRSKVPRSTSFL